MSALRCSFGDSSSGFFTGAAALAGCGFELEKEVNPIPERKLSIWKKINSVFHHQKDEGSVTVVKCKIILVYWQEFLLLFSLF